MLSGGQKFGLLSTTLNNTSSISNINEFGNSNFDGSLTDGLLGEGGTSRKPGSHSNSKSVVLVKLTDSALKAIAEYVKQRVSRYLYILTIHNTIYSIMIKNCHNRTMEKS